MNSRYPTPDADDDRRPDCTGDPEDQPDARQLAPEPDADEPDEAGYGYGV